MAKYMNVIKIYIPAPLLTHGIFVGSLTALLLLFWEVRLVPRVVHSDGYSRFSLTRASAVVNCPSAFACFLFRSACQAATSSVRVCLSGMRRSRHCLDSTLSSDSERSSQLPCLGVSCHSNRSTSRRASAAG